MNVDGRRWNLGATEFSWLGNPRLNWGREMLCSETEKRVIVSMYNTPLVNNRPYLT